MTISYRLDELLKLRGLTAREVSKRTGIATSTLSAIRKNNAERIDRKTLNRLCEALRCTPGDLIVYTPDPVLPTPASVVYPPTEPTTRTVHEG